MSADKGMMILVTRVVAWLERAGSTTGLRQQLGDLGVTHVLIHKRRYQIKESHPAPPAMLEKEFVLRVSKETDQMVKTMLDEHATLRYSDETYLVFELNSYRSKQR